jgi:preprotein translocase subunit YajC
LWGFFAEQFGYPSIFLSSAVCIVIAGLVYWFMLKKQIQQFSYSQNLQSKL